MLAPDQLRRRQIMLAVNNCWADDGVSFDVPLKTDLLPRRARGSPTPTYTNATARYFTDFEGLLKQVPSGCARFTVARFVQNTVTTTSENFNSAAWIANDGAHYGGGATIAVLTGSQTDPYGGTAAYRMQADRGAAGYSFILNGTAGGVSGRTYTWSIWAKSNTGSSQTVSFYGAQAGIQNVITVTTAWKRFSVTQVFATDAGIRFGAIAGSQQTIDILVYGAQREDVTGQSNQNPSEYVSVGVRSAPYHGAGVDGCKYFSYQNGNTVSSNVVTEAQGAAISASTLKGDFAEGARTNLCLQSEVAGATWTQTNITITADQAVAPNGTTTMDKLATTSTNAFGGVISQALVISSGAVTTVSAHYKYGDSQWIYLSATDNVANGVRCWFDIQNGVVGSIVAFGTGWSGSNATITPSGGGYRVSFTVTPTGTAFYPGASASVDADTSTAGTAGKFSYWWGHQAEAGAFASSYIPTTTVAVTRNADVDAYASSGNINAAAGAIKLEFTPTHTPSGTVFLCGTYVDANNYTGLLHDGTNLIMRKRVAGANTNATIVNAFVAGTTYKVAGRWTATGTDVFLNGTKGTGATDATTAQIGTTIQIGADGNSLQQPFASEKNLLIFGGAPSDSYLQGITT